MKWCSHTQKSFVGCRSHHRHTLNGCKTTICCRQLAWTSNTTKKIKICKKRCLFIVGNFNVTKIGKHLNTFFWMLLFVCYFRIFVSGVCFFAGFSAFFMSCCLFGFLVHGSSTNKRSHTSLIAFYLLDEWSWVKPLEKRLGVCEFCVCVGWCWIKSAPSAYLNIHTTVLQCKQSMHHTHKHRFHSLSVSLLRAHANKKQMK